MWKQGLAGRLWESAAAVVNSMPIYSQKKKKKKEEEGLGFGHLRIVENACHSAFPQGEQLHNAITLD